jgi:NADPH:quinone reductase-like Zn-dependent oxidoreductase
MHGMKVITTCSPKHCQVVKKLGATHVLNHRSTDVIASIKDLAPNLKYFFDTIGSEKTTPAGCLALGDSEPVMCTVRPGKAHTEEVLDNVKITSVLMWTAFGEAVDFRGTHFPVK